MGNKGPVVPGGRGGSITGPEGVVLATPSKSGGRGGPLRVPGGVPLATPSKSKGVVSSTPAKSGVRVGPGGVSLATPAKSAGRGGPFRVPGGVALTTPAKSAGHGGALPVPGGVALATPTKFLGRGGPPGVPGGVPLATPTKFLGRGGPFRVPGGVPLATPSKSAGRGGPLRVPGGIPLATPSKSGRRGGPLKVPGGVALATPVKPAERGVPGEAGVLATPAKPAERGVALATSFKCFKCEFKINDWKLYLEHFTITHLWFDGLDIPCKCGHKAKNAQQFEEHIRSVHGHEFKCEKCDFVATSVLNFSKHKSDSHRQKEKSNLSCKSCSFVFCTNGSLKDHITMKHPEFSSKNLNESPIIIGNQKKLDGHYVKNTNSSVNFQEKEKASLTSTKESGQNSVKTIKCALCDMIFPHSKALNFHMNNVHNGQNSMKGVTIKEELKTTTSNRGILHEANTPVDRGIKSIADKNVREFSKSVESGGKSSRNTEMKKLFKCWNCTEICSNQDNHDCFKGKFLVCDHCDFKHLEIKIFLNHVTKNHPGLAIPCHICKSKSKTVNTFKIHVNGMHTRNFQCDKCGKFSTFFFKFEKYISIQIDAKKSFGLFQI